MAAIDTTAWSYWLNWRVLICAIILLATWIIVAILVWRYEGTKRREIQENEQEPPGIVYEDEAWNACLRRIHPVWLLVFRVFSFLAMSALLIADIVNHGGHIYIFYTEWTFTLVTFYFGYASLVSIYGCFIYNKQADGNEEIYADVEEQVIYRTSADDNTSNTPNTPNTPNTFKASDTHSEIFVRKKAGLPIYIFQIIFQTCAGAVVLTDIVFWGIIYGLTKGFRLHFLNISMHSFNVIFLLGDSILNSLRFPFFRIAYFVLWSLVYTTFQWILHAFINIRWPYQFLDLSSKSAPLWYLGVCLMHILCYGVFASIFKIKNAVLRKYFPEF